MKNNNSFPALLEKFFTYRLIAQRCVSQHTIASYRDTFRLLLKFANKYLKKQPSCIKLDDLDAPFISIDVPYPGSTPEEVERQITRPAEEVLATIGGISEWSPTQVKTVPTSSSSLTGVLMPM